MTYPIHRSRQKRKRAIRKSTRTRRRRTGCILSLTVPLFLLLFAGIGLFGAAINQLNQLSERLPPPGAVAEAYANRPARQPIVMLAQDDAEIGTVSGDWSEFARIEQPPAATAWVQFEQLPDPYVAATIALHDPQFWERDPAAWAEIMQLILPALGSGGEFAETTDVSGIVDYLIRQELNLFGLDLEFELELEEEGTRPLFGERLSRTLRYKIIERVLLQNYAKEELLAWYANRAYYGNLAYGAAEAAQTYFAKPLDTLSTAEATMLAPTPRHPEINLIDRPDAAKLAQEEALTAMFQSGSISQEQLIATRFTPLAAAGGTAQENDLAATDLFQAEVVAALIDILGAERTHLGGIRVYTTLDQTLQREAACTAAHHLNLLAGAIEPVIDSNCLSIPFLPEYPSSEIGINQNIDTAEIVIINPKRGEINAMIGLTLDHTRRERQPAGMLAPFTYLTGFSQRYTPATMLYDIQSDLGSGFNGIPYEPANFDGIYRGPVSVREALANRYHPPAAQMLSWIGPGRLIETLASMGVSLNPASTETLAATDLNLHWGGGAVSLTDLTFAYSVLGNGGRAVGRTVSDSTFGFETEADDLSEVQPILIRKIETLDGEILFEQTNIETRQVVAPELTYLITDILSDQENRCSVGNCPAPLELMNNRPSAVHVAQSGDFRDLWAIGYTPQLVTGVWVGNLSNEPAFKTDAVLGAAPIWHAMMQQQLLDAPIEVRQRPENIVGNLVCIPSGLLPTGLCPTKEEIFVAGTTPNRFDNLYKEFRINQETGLLATASTPLDVVTTANFLVFPAELQSWVEERQLPQPPQEYDTFRQPKEIEGFTILSPARFETITEPVEIRVDLNDSGFSAIRLSWYRGLNSEKIELLNPNQARIRLEREGNLLLGMLNPTELPEGAITLLITAFRADDSIAEIAIPVTIERD